MQVDFSLVLRAPHPVAARGLSLVDHRRSAKVTENTGKEVVFDAHQLGGEEGKIPYCYEIPQVE